MPGPSRLSLAAALLLLVSVVTIKFSDMFLDSRVGALDRTLGFVFGLGRGLLIVVVAFLFFVWLVPERSQPDWVKNTKSRVVLENTGKAIMSMLPEDPEGAIDDAADYARRNGLSDEEIESIAVTTTYYPNDTIEVALKRDVGFFFGPVVNVMGGVVAVAATARTGAISGSSALAPLAVEKHVFEGLEPGDQATLKYNATNNVDGNFLPLSLDASGASEYGKNLQFGSNQWLCSQGAEKDGCPSLAPTEPGNVIGQTRQSLDWIMANTSTGCDSYNELFTIDDQDPSRLEMRSTCNRFIDPTLRSYRVVLVPIIESLCNGKCDVTVLDFAMFFIEGYSCTGSGQGNSCDLWGRYAQASLDTEGLIGPFDEDASVTFARLVK